MKFIFTMLFALELTHWAAAQTNFEPGSVVTAEGDTLKGYIDYRNWEFNPTTISYHGTNDMNIRTFDIHSIRSFEVHQEIYESAGIDIEISPYKDESLAQDQAFHVQPDTVFLRAVVIGSKSLFYYMAADGHENFYILDKGQFELLEHKKYLSGISTEMTIAENNRYRGQLNSYLQGCIGVTNKLNAVKYTMSSLQRLFKYYYQCTSSSPDYTKATDRVPPQLSVFVGGSSSSMQVRNPLIPYLDKTTFSHSKDISGGIALNIFFARTHQHWSVDNELLYASGTFSGHYEEPGLTGQTTVYDSKIGHDCIKLHTLVGYTYPVGRLKFGALAGVSNGLVFNITNQLHEVDTYYSRTDIYDKKALSFTQDYQNGLVFGLSAKMNSITLGLRYETDDWNDSKIHFRRMYCFLGYTL